MDLKRILPLIKYVYKTDLSFIWFAGGHAARTIFFSKLFRKKTIVVVGGYEVANVPEIGYGLMTSPKSARRVKYVLENADKILAVDDSLKMAAIENAGVDGQNIQIVPTGYDNEKFKPGEKKENLVLTVGNIIDIVVKRKGFDAFVETAKYLPDIEFVLVGKHVDTSIEYLKSIAPSNVKFTGFVSDKELVSWYQKAKVYCQLSRFEGLPNALCEAMLCECVPVGTRYCGIPTAIGDTGFYVPYGDPKATAEAIREALKSDKGKKARERIKNMFPIEQRETELIKIIEEIMNNI
jgi:glycosyltransferase involved in cell wall biosynthesis